MFVEIDGRSVEAVKCGCSGLHLAWQCPHLTSEENQEALKRILEDAKNRQ